MKIKRVCIKDICEFIGGSQPPKSKFVYEPKDGYIRLIQTRDRLNDNFATYIPVDSTKKYCQKDDILIGRYGPPIFQIFRGFEGAYNVAIMKANPLNGINKDYLYYFLLQKSILRYVESMSLRTGGQTGVELDSLYEYPVELPDTLYQNRVAKVLLNIDSKITNNNAIISELEAMAKTLYDYWFLQFDFPDENGRPYKSSGGKMVWNEDLKREIPEGWEVAKLKDVCDNITDGEHNTVINDESGDCLLLSCKNLLNNSIVLTNEERKINRAALEAIRKRTKLEKGDILVSSVGTIGETVLLNTEPENIEFQRSVAILKPNKRLISSYYLYECIKSLKGQLQILSHGAVQRCIFISDINEVISIIPLKKLLEKYDALAVAIFNNITEKQKENQELASLRDFLLPMLMNGQVTFKENDE